MKKNPIFPFVLIIVFVLAVGLACGKSTDQTATSAPQVIIVTATPEVISVPTEALASEAPVTTTEAQPYFTEEFDTNMDNYSYFVKGGGDESKMDLRYENSQLVFDLNGPYLWPYVTYDAYTYTDVRVDIEAENAASNKNSVTIVCRYNKDLGWYEFNIANDGTWFIAYYDAVMAKDYIRLYDGGSTAIHMGRDTNTYTAICQGNNLSLYINGVLTKTVQNKDLKEGFVGIGVSSYDVYPVRVNMNYMTISQP